MAARLHPLRPDVGAIIAVALAVLILGTLAAVAWQGRGLLILGGAGAGKSSLALWLMALGARLVADDRTWVKREGARLVAWCPASIRGQIEARGIGILRADPADPVHLVLAVDLDRPEPDRLPPYRKLELLGLSLPLVLGQGRDHLAPVLLQFMTAGRLDPQEP